MARHLVMNDSLQKYELFFEECFLEHGIIICRSIKSSTMENVQMPSVSMRKNDNSVIAVYKRLN